MVMTTTSAAKNRSYQSPTADAFLKPLPVKGSKSVDVNSATKNNAKLQIKASLKEKAATVTLAALMATMVVPESASAADSFSPSLKNFLLSIGAGGFVVFAIIGAVIGVSNFDSV
ncbi:hypothetical protein F511_23043 [Dorcoceras hygrometricum]|uniref:Photosystem II reaction center X protein n=1 Tax=Dorcoceras hygrometricum TaxID=472368 RepID=A0A2Z7CL29_9LAMI|nr:hypothetical protein F511_23043 [Dorcoceras hygrometricum]